VGQSVVGARRAGKKTAFQTKRGTWPSGQRKWMRKVGKTTQRGEKRFLCLGDLWGRKTLFVAEGTNDTAKRPTKAISGGVVRLNEMRGYVVLLSKKKQQNR